MSSYDEGNSSIKSSSSEETEIKLLRENELRGDAGLPPILSRRQALRNARAALSQNSDDMEVLDYGSADEEQNAKVDLCVSESSEDDEEDHQDLDVVHMEQCVGETFDMNISASMEVEINDTVVNAVHDEVPVIERSAVYDANANTVGKLDDMLRLANHYARGPRDEAIRERAKNMELKEFILSKGFDLKDVNAQLGQSDPIRLRQVDDYGFIVATKDFNDLKKSFTVEKGILTLENEEHSSCNGGSTAACAPPKGVLALPWNVVVKNSNMVGASSCSNMTTTNRVSALDPSRLTYKESIGASVCNPTLSYKPTSTAAISGESQCTAIAPPLAFLKSARKMWDSSLVAYFASASLTFERTKAALFNLWGSMGLQKVFYNAKGFYTLKFKNVSDMETVLKLGSIIIDKRKLFLRPWMEGTHFQRNQLTSVPIWVKFVNVPHSYWSVEGLSYIASAVGVPISLDSPTSNLEPMKYARICVNLKFHSPRPKEILVPVLSDEDGTTIMVRVQVEYPILPPNCSHCSCFGHALAKCSAYRSHLDVLEMSPASVEKENNGLQSAQRSGKEPMVAVTDLVPVQKGNTPTMINFLQQNDNSVNKVISTKKAGFYETVIGAAKLVTGDSSNVSLQNSKSPVSSYGHWSMGPCGMETEGNIKPTGVKEGIGGVGQITIDLFGTTQQPPISDSKPKRKKRAKKSQGSKGVECPNTIEKPVQGETTEGSYLLHHLQNTKGLLVDRNVSQQREINDISNVILETGEPSSQLGFTRVTRRTAKKKPALEGNPASRYQ